MDDVKRKADESGVGLTTQSGRTAVESDCLKPRGSSKSGASALADLNNKPRTTTKSGKLPVAEPASFRKFFLVLVMHICRRILIIDTTKLAWFYICFVTVVSLLTDLFPFPKSYFAEKNNVWNQFVKLGWGWTLLVLAPFVHLTTYVLCLGNVKIVYRHLARLIVSTAWWYVVTSGVSLIEHQTGACSGKNKEYTDRYSCVKNGGKWESWIEISGHSFLLVLCILTIAEEVKIFREWSGLNELIRKEDQKLVSKLTHGEFEALKSLYSDFTPLIRCVLVLLACFQLLWNMMLLSTVLYFHNMPDKFLGVLFAALAWFLSYKVLYRSGNSIPEPLLLGKNPNFKHLKV